MDSEKNRLVGINSLGRPLSETEAEELETLLWRALKGLKQFVSVLLR